MLAAFQSCTQPQQVREDLEADKERSMLHNVLHQQLMAATKTGTAEVGTKSSTTGLQQGLLLLAGGTVRGNIVRGC
jgi:hypothetical protein